LGEGGSNKLPDTVKNPLCKDALEKKLTRKTKGKVHLGE